MFGALVSALVLAPAIVVLGAIACGSVRRHPSPHVRACARVLAVLLLWVAFDLSYLALWGVRLGAMGVEFVGALLVLFVALQPVAVLVSVRATRTDGP